MTLWIIFAALTIGTLGLLVVPLMRRAAPAPARVDYDIVVYRDQLAEVARDVERGLLTTEQAAAAKTEIHRRMLAAEDAELREPKGEFRTGGKKLRLAAVLVIVIGLPAGSLAVYNRLGSPELPGQPFASRQADPEFRLTELAARLAADLQQKPDADGYVTLARTYTSMRRYSEAAAAFQQAIQLGAVNAENLSDMAESIVLSNDGQVVPEARQAFKEVLVLDKDDPRARFYLGLAKAQVGEYREAVSIWRDLESGSREGAPWLPMLKEHIQQYAKLGGFDPATINPVPPAPAGVASAKGPNPHGDAAPPAASGMPGGAAAAAVMAQTPEQRAKTIQAMVDGLAARLQQSPDDYDGWMKLARAYKVLGKLDEAKAAAARAVKLKPQSVEPKLALAEVQLAQVKKGERLPAEFVANMRDVQALDPTNNAAMYYVGLAEAEAGHSAAARTMWTKLLAKLPADGPQHQEVAKLLDTLPKN